MRIGNIAGSLFLFVQFLQVSSWCNRTADYLSWMNYNGALYAGFFSNSEIPYDGWESNCKRYGGSLTTAKTAEENAFLKSISSNWRLNYIIGLRYVGVTWMWNDDTPAIYTNWALDAEFRWGHNCTEFVFKSAVWYPINCSSIIASACKCVIAVECNSSNPCSNPFAECTDGICQCRSGYTLSGTNCTAVVGSPCDATNGCSSPYADCTNGTCQCRLGYTQNGTICKAAVGSTCDATNGCSSSYADCTSKTCQCRAGYIQNGTLCKADLNSSCTTSIECSDQYAECKVPTSGTNGTCQCKNKYSVFGGICKADLNSSCDTSIGCSDQNAECKARTSGANNTCQCKNNYSVVGGICKGDLNSSCTTSIGCSDPYAECKVPTSGTNGTCQCKNKYSVVGGICKAAIPEIISLRFTIRMTEMNFTDDLNNSSTVIYNTARDNLVQALDILLEHCPGYSGASLLRFRRGSVLVDAKVSVDQTGNISNIQTAIQQSVSSGYIGLNGTTIAVDSTYFAAYIGDGYFVVDNINITGDTYNGTSINNGTSVHITCMIKVVGNVIPTITWKYNGNVMNPVNGSRIRISNITVDPDTLERQYRTVSFIPILSSDSGTYECVVTDGNLAQSVMNKTVIVWSPPLVSIKPVTQTVNAESTVNITCQVENDVQITRMVWYRNDTEINLSNQISVETSLTVSILKEKNISQTTIYKCRGENAAGPGNTRQANIYVVLPGSQPGGICDTDTDKRETEWSRTLQGTYDNKSCPAGMSGEAVRYCSQGGVWSEASYDNCINKTLLELKTLTDKIKNGLAPDVVQESLIKLTSLTNPNNVVLQKAEVQVVSSVLENIIQISSNTNNITNSEVENFLEIASNVIDVKNRPSWQAVIKEDNDGASVILRNVEEYSIIKANSINSSDEPVKRFTKKNLFVEIGYKPVSDIRFPSTTANGSGFNNDPGSRFVLSQDALNDGNYTSYSGAFFNNILGIIRTTVFHNGSMTKTTDDLHINSAVMSLQLDPSPQLLSSPITLTFKHLSEDYSNPLCSFWMFKADGREKGAWSSQGCKLVSTTDDTTVCQCDHLTNFAILMSPGETPEKDQVPLSIISIIGCAISIFCLSVTMIAHFIAWRYVKSTRSCLLMNLCLALLISYIIFLAGIDRTENKNACTAVAALLHYFYLVVFFLMLAFGIEIAVSVIYVFATRSRVQWLLPVAWILPAVIVAVSMGVTKLEGYGNEKFCWLSIEDGLIWAFVGPAALVILLNFIIILVVFQRMFSTSAMMTKSDKVKAKTAVRSLCVLLPITGITWVFGILSVNEDLDVFQYLFAIINSLQGLFIFLIHCFFNHHLRNAIKQINATRKRSQILSSLPPMSSSRTSRPNIFDSLDEGQKKEACNLEGKNSFLGSDRHAETCAKDEQLNNEYAESSHDRRQGHNVSIKDVKISNNLCDTEVRRDHGHAEVATTSLMRANDRTMADIDIGDYKILRKRQKYDYRECSRKVSNPGDRQAGLKARLDNTLRTTADGAGYQRRGQTSSFSVYKLATKSGFDPHDPRYYKSSRHIQDQSSSNERMNISTDECFTFTRKNQCTKNEKSKNAQTKRASKHQVYYKHLSSTVGSIPVSNSKIKNSKDYKSKRRSSNSSTSDKQHLPGPSRESSSILASKAKDIPTTKKKGKPWKDSSKRSHDYQYSEYHMAYIDPKIYLGRTENTAGYVSYNPYGIVHAYGALWMSTVNPGQYQVPHKKSGKKPF